MCIIIPVSHIPCAHTSSIWQYCTDASRSTAGIARPCRNVRLEKNGNLTSQLCPDCDNDQSIKGMNMRGNRNLHIITQPAKVEGDDEDGNDSGYHSDVIHEEPKLPDIDEQPLSPRTMSPRHSRQRKRTSSRQRTLVRKSSWKPNLHSTSTLDDRRASSVRRDSIDSVLSSSDYRSWYSSANKMFCADREVSISESQIPHYSSELNARSARGSTLLHPSSPPPMETTANAQVAKAYNFPQIVNVQKTCAANRPILQARKNSTLLHPSSPQEELPAEHNAASHFQHNLAETRTSRYRPAAPVRRASSLLHPSSPAEAMTPDATHRTVLRVQPTRAVGSTKDARTRSRRGSRTYQSSRCRHISLSQINPIEDSASHDIGRDLLGSNATYRRRQRSILHSSLSDSDDSADDEDFGMNHGAINFSLDMFGQANHQRPEVLKNGVYEDFLLTSTAVAARQKRGFFRSRY